TLLQAVVLPAQARGGPLSPKKAWADIVLRGATTTLLSGSSGPKGQGIPYCCARTRPSSCRVRLDFPALARLDRPAVGALPASTRETLERLARALTRRRVGLALGGSGAWGYASAALILELGERGMPIDLVGGVSSGALIGAYHCAAGAEGIAR